MNHDPPEQEQIVAQATTSEPEQIVAQATTSNLRGIRLDTLTWQQAEDVLTPETVVVIPLGAASKEHGPHLQLNNDWLIADYYTQQVLERAEVVVAPTIGFHYYPAFKEYPGSISLRAETARDLVVDVCRSLANYGPRRFYVLNTGVSTQKPLEASAKILAEEGIALTFTDILKLGGPIEAEISKQRNGTHADEIETSMMLVIAPQTVNMALAVAEDEPKTKPGLSRSPDGPGHLSRSGIWGDPTLATRDKGVRYLDHMVRGILDDIEHLREAPLHAHESTR